MALTRATISSDLLQVARNAGQFETLLVAVRAVGLEDALRVSGPFTLLAPTDAAFARLPAGSVEELLHDRARLLSVLLFHVVNARLALADIARLNRLLSAQGQPLRVDALDGVRIEGAQVVRADIPASNGIIHIIDRVLLPR